MDEKITFLVENYLLRTKKDVASAYQFLFKIYDKKQLIQNKQQYLLKIREISLMVDYNKKPDPSFLNQYFKGNHVHSSSPSKIKGIVKLRFSPNPNALPTIGNYRGLILNNYFYENGDEGSQFFLRFDDTDPKNKPALLEGYSSYLSILEENKINPTGIIYASKRFSLYYQYCKKFLLNSVLKIENYEENNVLQEFEKMVRNKSSYKKIYFTNNEQKFYCFRTIEHHEKKGALSETTETLWPTLFFQTSIDDHQLEITHAIRGKDLYSISRRQKDFCKRTGLTCPEFLYWGRIKVLSNGTKYSVSSSTYLQKANMQEWGNFEDEIFSYQNLRKKYSSSSLKQFILSYGFTENDILFDLKRLSAFDKKNNNPC